MKAWVKYLIVGIVAVVAIINVYIYRDVLGGAILGGALAIVYFELTGSQLNFTFKKKV